ncbi:fimbrial biogenesis usher protein [Leclercia adecarboxylata]|uniref:fimbrial biogenesis usher protein n=1 Tax=Leclercia adecarboxylata TaxID=83655 RepID=UPI00057B0631|nr:fimbrial biogenesis usher protein [Leclercia adecarboxylata]
MFKRTLLVCALSLILSRQGYASDTDPSPIEFDSETLKSLGIDPGISGYFAQKARFMPGEISITVIVNGENKGNIIASFNQDGELCFSKSFIELAGLRLPADYTEGCYDYLKHFPETVLNPVPGRELVELVVSADNIARQSLSAAEFITDGSAGVLNYSAMSSRSEYSGDSATYSQMQLDGGVNVAGWLLRSQQLLSHSQGQFNSENGQTYLQRTFVGLRTTAMAGEVNMNNALLEGVGLYGMTFTPEDALEAPEGRIKVSGIANTSQARVEVRQQGILIHSTLVPVGPFTLTDISLRNYTSDLNVTVIENDGNKHSYAVPSTLYLQRMGNPAGFFLSLGRVSDNYDDKPLVVSASNGWRLLSGSNINVGAIVASDFQAVGASIDAAPLTPLSLGLKANQSYDRKLALHGQSYRAEASMTMASGLSITASSAYYTSGYREFSQFIDRNYTATKKLEYSVGLQWSSPGWGTFSSSFYETKSRQDDTKTGYVTAGWGDKIFSAYVSANWQRQLNGSSGEGKKEDSFYLNVSIPLGKSHVNTYVRHGDSETRYGSTMSGNLGDETIYTLGTDKGRYAHDRSVNANISSNLHYTQLMLNGSVAGQDRRSYTGSLQGGIVAHGDGITLSPVPVRETFGIASLAQPLSGVKIDTPQGPVWTDSRGYAVLPALNAWRNSRIEVSTETLPKNVDIGNGTHQLKQGRGSVGKVQFTAVTQRRVLLEISMADGKKLPKNLAITDEDGNYLTTSVDEGVVFLNNVNSSQVLLAQGESGVCRIKLALPEVVETGVFYETAKGVCL